MTEFTIGIHRAYGDWQSHSYYWQ